MKKMTFGSRFQAASAKAYVYATSMVSETLPPNLRINVQLNQSYDANVNESHEVVYPEDSSRDSASLEHMTIEGATEELWRDKRVPEWIDLSVVDFDSDTTIIRALCCGRFTRKSANMYHIAEGYPPFHVLSPELPPSWLSVEESGRFSLRSLAERRAER